jgi:dienelactone hydrolase
MKPIIAALCAISICFSIGCKKDDPLKGINKTALFADPIAEELDGIRHDWQSRDLIPTNVHVEETHKINQKLSLYFVSFRLYGLKEYAGVLVPMTTTPLPVYTYISGFGLEIPYSSQNIKLDPTGTIPFVYIVPALRGQYLEMVVDGITYKTPASEGKRDDAFDGATDDALAALNAVGQLFQEADTSVVMVRGGSRGATVALLMGERDKRIKRVVCIAGPTDLLKGTEGHQNDHTYKFQFLDSLIARQLTIAQTRKKLIASSPVYFCEQLPRTQLHLAQNDKIVPTWHGDKLIAAVEAAGVLNNLELFIYPGRNHDNIADNNVEMNERINAFFY